MIIGSRAGHSKNCLGAVSLRNEWACMSVLEREVNKILKAHGHTIIDCNSSASTENGELSEGCRKANAQQIDIFLSYHMNASKDHKGHGAECWVHPNARSSCKEMASRISSNLSKLGFYNRGVKTGLLYEMKNVNAPNIIIETCFCDNEKDINIWSPTPYEKMARYIANAIDPSIPLEEKPKRWQVRVYAFTTKEEAQKCSERITKELKAYNVVEELK